MKSMIILANGFETIEALGTADLLVRAGIEVSLISAHQELIVTSAQGIPVTCHQSFSADLSLEGYRLVVLPGGMGGTNNIMNHPDTPFFLQRVLNNQDMYLGAICAAPLILAHHHLLDQRTFTSYPTTREQVLSLAQEATYLDQEVVVDKNLITSQGPFTTFAFAYQLIELLVSPEKSLQIKADLLDQR